MTEAEWNGNARPTGMLFQIRSHVSERKILLFNIACCRRVWGLLGEEDRKRVAEAESIADKPDGIRRLELELEPENLASLALVGLRDAPVSRLHAELLTSQTSLRLRIIPTRSLGIGGLAYHAALLAPKANPKDEMEIVQAAEELGQASLVRDIFGNPFRPVEFDSLWRTAEVLGLARGIYEDWAFDRLPLLADALTDAGCDHKDILDHCRSEGPHVRGCWVVDLVLGKD